MKKITLFLLTLFTCWQIDAQVSGYGFSQSAGTFTPITGGTVLATPSADDAQYSVVLPTAFTFNGTSFTDVRVSSNGFITFGTTNPGTTNYTPISSTTAYSGSISAYGRDLNSVGAGSETRWQQVGNEIIFQWLNVRRFNIAGEQANFQIRLNTSNNEIKVVYGVFAAGANTTYPQVGLRGATNADYNNRTAVDVTGDWINSTAGGSNAATCYINSTTPTTIPSNGLTYTWTAPSCVAPGGFAASAITTNSATISWSAAIPAPATGYEYYYSNVNTAPSGAGTPTGTLTANLTPLAPATVYYVWLRSDCGGTFSAWNGPFTFTTNCVSVTNFTEGFESTTGALFPTCWAKVGATGTSYTQASAGITGARNLYMYSSTVASRPVVSMTPVSNANAGTHRMTMKVRGNFSAGETIELGYLTNPADANTFTAINSIVTNSASVPQNFITIPSGMPAGDVVFALRTGTALLSVLVDDVIWEPIPTTPPTCSTISTPANNALNVAIDTNISWAANIDATGYYLKIGYSAGGSEVLANTDLGNVLTYNPPVDFDYSTSYFVTLTPYNANGSATGCTETTFTTRDAPPTGSVCADPIIIDAAALPYTTTDNTNLYGDDYSTGAPCSNTTYMTGDDVVYTISPATNMSVDILLSNLTATWSGIHVMDGCPGTSPNCIAFMGNSGSGNRDLQDVLLTGGTTYYIVISTNAAPQSVGYTLTITENTCVSPTVTFSSSNNCPTTNFNAVANITNLGSATSLTVTDNQGSPSQNVTATGNVTFGPYAFGTNVVLTVTNNQDGSCVVVSPNLTVAACPPANDDCLTAQVLTPGGVFATNAVIGTTVAATTVTGLTYACQTSRANEVWYSVVVPPSGTITIETQADGASALTDTVLSVFSGTCGALVEVGCDDDSGVSAFSILNLTQPAGSTLYIGVWRWSSATNGTFQVSAYDASLSSSSFDNNAFKAYPNPVKDILNLSYNTEMSKVQVVNMLGQVVIDRKMNATEGQIDMTGLNSGAYIVNVTVGDTVKAIKVIKQ
jgi:hypothetical protein